MPLAVQTLGRRSTGGASRRNLHHLSRPAARERCGRSSVTWTSSSEAAPPRCHAHSRPTSAAPRPESDAPDPRLLEAGSAAANDPPLPWEESPDEPAAQATDPCGVCGGPLGPDWDLDRGVHRCPVWGSPTAYRAGRGRRPRSWRGPGQGSPFTRRARSSGRTSCLGAPGARGPTSCGAACTTSAPPRPAPTATARGTCAAPAAGRAATVVAVPRTGRRAAP